MPPGRGRGSGSRGRPKGARKARGETWHSVIPPGRPICGRSATRNGCRARRSWVQTSLCRRSLDDVAHAGLHAPEQPGQTTGGGLCGKAQAAGLPQCCLFTRRRGRAWSEHAHLLHDDFRTFLSIYEPTKQNDAHRAERLHSGENSTWGEKWQEQEKPEQGLREQATAGAGVR
jgi:hypothetical protein